MGLYTQSIITPNQRTVLLGKNTKLSGIEMQNVKFDEPLGDGQMFYAIFSDLFSNTSESVKTKGLKYLLPSVNRYQKSKIENLPNLRY